MPFLPLFLPRVPEVRGPIPAGLGGDAPLQVEWTPCDLDDNPSHRRAHEDTGRAFRQINRAENFPRTGTVPAGGLWKPNTTPQTIAIEDDETGEPIVVNLHPEPGRDPNLRDGDEVVYYYKGDTAWNWMSYHDDPVRTLKFWTGAYDDIRAGWARADGTDNSVANGGTGLDYVTPGFIVCANTAGTAVSAVPIAGESGHGHAIQVFANLTPLFTGFTDVGIMPHEEHHHEITPNVDVASSGGSQAVIDDPIETSGVLDASHSALVLEHFSGEKSDIDGVPVFAGGNTTINVDDDIFASPIQAGDLIVFDDGTSVVIDSVTDDNTVVVVGDYSSQTVSLWVANTSGHRHSIATHVHLSSIVSTESHTHGGGVPAYMTAIPIERIP